MSRSANRLHAFFLAQPNSAARIEAVRLSVAMIILILLLWGPYAAFYGDAGFLYQPGDAFGLPAGALVFLEPVRWMTIAAAVLSFTRLPPLVPTVGLLIGFALVNILILGFPSRLWAFTTHLLAFLGIIAIALAREPGMMQGHPTERLRSSAKPAAASFAIAAMQCVVVTLYFQTGLSKLWHSGLDWFSSGRTAIVFAHQFGTPAGQWLLGCPEFFRVGSVMVGVLELGFPFFFLFERLRKPLIGAAIVFHCITLVILNISFWHLWMVFPALFFFRADRPHLPAVKNAT